MSKLSRTFTTIDNWPDFCEAWSRVSGEAEAIGLLYAGAGMTLLKQGSSTPVEGMGFNAQVSFFLRAKEEVVNERVRTVAIQRLIAGPMQEAQVISWRGGEAAAEAYHSIVCFLAEGQHGELSSPPYPRTIICFLSYAFQHWAAFHKLNCLEQRKFKEHPSFWQYGETQPLVGAMCLWGLADFLTHNPAESLHEQVDDHHERIAGLKTLQAEMILPCLERHVYATLKIQDELSRKNFLSWPVSEATRRLPKNVHDLRDGDNRTLARQLVAKAILWCQVWAKNDK